MSVGKSGDYAFTPAVVDRTVYAAKRDGRSPSSPRGRQGRLKINAGPAVVRVGANAALLVVRTLRARCSPSRPPTAKAAGGRRWPPAKSSLPPAVGDDGVAVKSGDNRVFLFDAADGGPQMGISALDACLVGAWHRRAGADRYLFVGFPAASWSRCRCKRRPGLGRSVAMPKGATGLIGRRRRCSTGHRKPSDLCAVAFQGRVAPLRYGAGRGTGPVARDFVGAINDAGWPLSLRHR